MFNPMDLSGRTILVTGASSGIGRETAVVLSRLGARVILVARTKERLVETLSLMAGEGHVVHPFDLSCWQEIPRLFSELIGKTGPMHGLVHSAGMTVTLPFRMFTTKHIDDVMRLNFNAAVALAQQFSKKKNHVPASGIVFISSISGMVGKQGNAIYSASKAALNGLMKTLAVELAPGIRVNCVNPGYVMTELTENLNEKLTDEGVASIQAMHPLGIGSPVDVANAVAFLLADSGRWITGTTMVVDGGYTAH